MKTITSLEEINKGTAVVKFYADWCGPCKMMNPIVEKAAAEFPQVQFVAVNIDESRDISEKFNIQGVPTIVLVKDGAEVNRLVGFKPFPDIKKFVETA